MKTNLSETDKAYIAGFFDGEGHISIIKNKPMPPRWKNPRYQLVAIITNTSESIIDGIQFAFENIGSKHGPYPSSKINGKPLFHLGFYGNACKKFLKTIQPYLILKQSQALLALDYPLLMKRTCPHGGLTSLELTARETSYQLMKSLNRKGVHPHEK